MRVNQYVKEIERHGWIVKRQTGSHKMLANTQTGITYTLGLHDRDDLGKPMIARLNKALGVKV